MNGDNNKKGLNMFQFQTNGNVIVRNTNSIQFNSNWISIQIKLIVESGVQLNWISIRLKSMEILLQIDCIRIEIQLIGIAFNWIEIQIQSKLELHCINCNFIHLNSIS